MNPAARVRSLTVTLWLAVAASLPVWITAGYSRLLCVAAVLPLLAPLPGLLRGRRAAYVWASLFALPYFAVALTELLVTPAARWVAGASLLLVFGWFCAMAGFARGARARRG